jgi:hypothetical protein
MKPLRSKPDSAVILPMSQALLTLKKPSLPDLIRCQNKIGHEVNGMLNFRTGILIVIMIRSGSLNA